MTKIPPKGPQPPPPRPPRRPQRLAERSKQEQLEDKREDDGPEELFLGQDKTAAIDTQEELQYAGQKATEAFESVTTDPDAKEERKLEDDKEHDQKERLKASVDVQQQPGKPKGKADSGQSGMNKPAAAAKSEVKDGFETQKSAVASAKAALEDAEALAAAKAAEVNAQLRPSRPDDAMTVLHNAQEPGYFFTEDREGGAQGQEQPPEDDEQAELLAAVEEARAQLEGVKGITRVSPGRNERKEPVVVIVAARGFGEASMRQVPSKVRRFATLLALPYDLLPLRRERL